MKRLMISLIALIALYSIYYDFNTGTLTAFKKQDETVTQQPAHESPETENKGNMASKSEGPIIQQVTVEPGSTVLSISERLHNGPLPVSIEKLVKDFQLLNNGVEPEKIQIGKVYNFPVYNSQP